MKLKMYSGGLLMLFIAFFSIEDLYSQETKVMIRVLAKDAKFIGTSIGGAKIIVRDVETGKILDQGITRGSTGDTERIMNKPHQRNEKLSDETTAGFEAELSIDAPVFVSVEAHAPVNKKQAKIISSSQLWVISGKDITGDGFVLEVPGFVVDILSPQTHEKIGSESEIEIRTNIVMMCGCPITQDGIWNAGQYEVNAMVYKDGDQEKVIELAITEKPSTFVQTTTLIPGNYEIIVYAYDPITGNTGLDKTNIIVR